MQKHPDEAFILAAGRGTRLRPHTDHMPKPMVRVAGQSLISRALDRLYDAGIARAAVNLHHMAPVLEEHLTDRTKPDVRFVHEPSLLDTGGAVVNAINTLRPDGFFAAPFYVIAGDALWTNGPAGDALLRLARHWNPAKMDIITLLQPISRMTLTEGVGDFDLAPDGRVIRRPDKSGAYMWTNIRLNSPALYKNAPDGPFSFLELMDAAERAGRFFALVHDGDWHHISTPEDLARVDTALSASPEKVPA